MESLYYASNRLLSFTDLNFIRYAYSKINWNIRLIAITGARGSGKSTLMLQYIKKTYGLNSKEALYVSLDNLWFTKHTLLDLADEFARMGGKHLFLDEVHKYTNWSQEIKNIYDSYPELKVAFTGSSMLEIYKGNADLSRRCLHYSLHGLSFREYLAYEGVLNLDALNLEDILTKHSSISTEIANKVKILPLFKDYLKNGYYPYYKEDKNSYPDRLLNTLNVILEMDLPAIEHIDYYSVEKIKKLLYIISTLVPFTPNVSSLATDIAATRGSVLNYLHYLERGHAINMLSKEGAGLNLMTKPEKIYLHNTNLAYALSGNYSNIGNARETFFLNQLKAVAEVSASKVTDFVINKTYSFEVGGQNKDYKQLHGIENAFIAADDIEYGFANKIPLWMFGLMY